MRCIKILFIVVSIITGTCIGQENEQQDYPITSIENLFANPAKYDGKNISIVGILDLSHFEDANMNGIEIDWGCSGDSSPRAEERAWKRWMRGGNPELTVKMHRLLVHLCLWK